MEELRRADSELRRQNLELLADRDDAVRARYRHVFEDLKDPVLVTSLTGVVLDMNGRKASAP